MYYVKIGDWYVSGFSNTHYQPTWKKTYNGAMAFLSEGSAEAWAKKYLCSYDWEVVEITESKQTASVFP